MVEGEHSTAYPSALNADIVQRIITEIFLIMHLSFNNRHCVKKKDAGQNRSGFKIPIIFDAMTCIFF